MRKTKYIYDPLTLAYHKVERTWRHRLRDGTLFLVASALFGIIFFFLIQLFLESPKEKALKRELNGVLVNYEHIQTQLEVLDLTLEDLEKRDNEVYRVIFESEPIGREIRFSGIQGAGVRYESVRGLSNGALLERTSRKVEELLKRLSIQSESLDEVANLASNKKALLDALPAIKPVKSTPSVRFSSGFGYRIHPIFKVPKMHAGVDFTAKRGTPIYATGNGVVISNDVFGGQGFGNHVTIAHGFGYHTLYGHMDRLAVRQGQKVKRGDLIGYVGNSGRSTGPHLHYEVIRNGQRVNPINYFFNELTPAEYDALVKAAASSNQSFD